MAMYNASSISYCDGVTSTRSGTCGISIKSSLLFIVGGCIETVECSAPVAGTVEARDGVAAGVVLLEVSISESQILAAGGRLRARCVELRR